MGILVTFEENFLDKVNYMSLGVVNWTEFVRILSFEICSKISKKFEKISTKISANVD